MDQYLFVCLSVKRWHCSGVAYQAA